MQKRGICNRVKCLISALRMSENMDAKIYWPIKGVNHNCSFYDLFSNEGMGVTTVPRSVSPKNRWGTWRFYLTKKEVKSLPKNIYNIDYLYDKTPKHIMEELKECISFLKIQDEITEIVNDFSDSNFDSNTVSVHIRSWVLDGSNAAKVRNRAFSINSYFNVLDKMEDDKRFFIATDNDSMIKKSRKRYGKRVISYPHHHLNLNKSNSGKSAFIDMLLLSKNNAIVGDYKTSSFTEMAWWFGGCTAKLHLGHCCPSPPSNSKRLPS